MEVKANRELLETMSVTELLKTKDFFDAMMNGCLDQVIYDRARIVSDAITNVVAERFIVLDSPNEYSISTVGEEAVKRWLTDSQ